METVMVEMSGGVDSSTTAAILVSRGFDVRGVTFGGGRAVRDAKLAADRLGIPHHVADVAELFRRTVIDYFINEYNSGRTPNPCVACNRHVKFGKLFDTADALGCAYVATGHYAVAEGGELRRGADPKKDQSYFLYPVLAAPIERILFPLGAMTKDETRALAKKLGLPAADRPESQDICFVPGTDYAAFLRSNGAARDAAGDIVDAEGNVIGRHNGIHNYTVGQRKGLGALGKPMYVKQIIPGENKVVAAEDRQIASGEAVIENAVASKTRGLTAGGRYAAQIRYKSAPVGATVIEIIGGGGDNRGNNANGAGKGCYTGLTIRIRFDAPVRAVAPGQSAVLYDGDTVVAGGEIAGA